MTTESEKSPRYNGIPKQVSRKDFNRYILPHLKKRVKGPKLIAKANLRLSLRTRLRNCRRSDQKQKRKR